MIESTAGKITNQISGGVTAPAGFAAAGVACGIKTSGLDLALVVATPPARTAGIFTTNMAVAAPLVVTKEHLRQSNNTTTVVVVNSGCANACTGSDGLTAARTMAADAAQVRNCRPEQVLISSTGVIGQPLNSEKVREGIAAAAVQLSRGGHRDAAEAILTTDRSAKETAVRVTLAGGVIRVGGMAKGAGMIEPNMATMLAFLTTDADIDPTLLQRALVDAAADTINAITVDGETSTNDMVLLLASGKSGVHVGEDDYRAFVAALRAVCRELALAIVKGGEGATKLVGVTVTGARSKAGRIGNVVLFTEETVFADREPAAAAHLKGTEVAISVDLGVGGSEQATIWTCDFSAEYVHINADYRT